MKLASMATLVLLTGITALSSATDVQGTVYGVWDMTGSPYNVTGDIEVPYGYTLTIEPGVEVIFQDHYKFEVRGKLSAVGTELNMITFTSDSTAIGWCGIRFLLPDNSSQMSYCIVEYGNAYSVLDDVDGYGGALLLKFANTQRVI